MNDQSLHLRFVYDAASAGSLRNAIQRSGIELRNETELFRRHESPVTLSFRVKTTQPGGIDLERPTLSTTVEPELVTPGGESALGSLLKFVAEVYSQTEPRYVFGMETWYLEAVNADHRYAVPSPVTEETLAAGAVLLAGREAGVERSPRQIAEHAKTSRERVCAAARKIRVQTDVDVPPVRDRAVDRVVAALDDELDVATGIDLVRVAERLMDVAESSIDCGPEWRFFADDATHGENPERTGTPVTPTRHDDGLTTEIGEEINGRTKGPSAAKRRLGRLRKRHRRTKLQSKRERNQMQGLLEIDRMASALGLPETSEERASVLFRSAHDANLLQGRSIEAVATASLYAPVDVPRRRGCSVMSSASPVTTRAVSRMRTTC